MPESPMHRGLTLSLATLVSACCLVAGGNRSPAILLAIASLLALP